MPVPMPPKNDKNNKGTNWGRLSKTLSFWILDRKSTRLNSSHSQISYAVFCLKKKKKYRESVTDINRTLAGQHSNHPSRLSHSPARRRPARLSATDRYTTQASQYAGDARHDC